MKKSANIVVVGSINFDFTSYVTDFPEPAQTLLANKSLQAMGGKGLNQAVAAACAGAQVTMVGCVGNDELGSKAINYLAANNINTKHVRKDENSNTGTASIFVSEQGQNMIVVNVGANACLTAEDIINAESVISKADVLITQLEVPEEAVKAALLMAKKHDVTSILNPAPAADFAKKLLPLVDIVTPNELETLELVGIDPTQELGAENAAKKFMKEGVNNVVITLGEYGSYIASESLSTSIPAFDVEVTDTTGAGDVLNGVLAAKLGGGLPLDLAVIQASIAAAISITRPMAQGSAPTNAEIMAFIEQN